MVIAFDSTISISPDVMIRKVGEESVLLDLKTERYLGLNAVGTRMWSVLGRADSIQVAYDELLQEFEVEPAQLRKDVEEFIDQLLDQQLIEAGRATEAGRGSA